VTLAKLPDPTAEVDVPAAAAFARDMLAALGIHCDGPSTVDTPLRYVRALLELTAGRHLDPADYLDVTFPAENPDPCMIVVSGVRFVSVCEHHLLPFDGTATVAYMPAEGAPIVGLSKLPRLVHGYAARPQVQERLGQQIVDAITSRLDTQGAACVIRSEHSCMSLRGVRAEGAEMRTSHLLGRFRDDATVRAEFLHLAG
jgi:GTP cyclohydrolase I